MAPAPTIMSPSAIRKPGPHKRSKWTFHEDTMLTELVQERLGQNWTAVSAAMPWRSGKQCRERWHNHLSPEVNKSDWTPAEDHLLAELHSVSGNAWCEIAKAIPGRTDNSVKNRWNTWLRHQVDENGLADSPSAAFSLAPKDAQMNKLTSLLRTNPQCVLASLVTEPGAEPGSPELDPSAGMDALVGLVQAKNRRELHQAAAALKSVISSIP